MLLNNTPQYVSASHIKKLAQTRGWVLAFAVLLFITGAFLIMGSISNLTNDRMNKVGSLINIAVSIFFTVAGIQFIQYCSNIKKAATSLNSTLLERAIEHQAKAWLWIGISATIYIVVFTFVIIAGLITTL